MPAAPRGRRSVRSLLVFVACFLFGVAGLSAPAIAQGVFESDDFNTCQGLDPRWTVVDPRGAGTVEVVGVGTGDAALSIRIAAGTRTDAWRSNDSVRLIQSASNGDFVAEMRIESVPDTRFQLVGLLVEQDIDDWLRFDFYSNGSRVYAFAGSTANGSSSLVAQSVVSGATELFVRVSRSGDQWTHQYSIDGTSWTTNATFTRALNVTGIGPFAGTAGPAPAFDARIDYVFDAAAPVVPEDGGPTGGDVTLQTATAGNGSGTIVVDPDQPTYACGDVVTLTAVPDPGSEFLGWSDGATGTENPLSIVAVANLTVTATFAAAGPPEISNVQVVPSARSAVLTWETSEAATSRVDYGLDPAYGGVVESNELRTEHSLQLTGLTTETNYHYSITAVDASLEASSTPDATFSTLSSVGPVSDDFSQCGPLGAQWTLVDPVGGALVDFVGTGSSDARLRIALPAGARRDAWRTNGSTRILQPSDDGDLHLEAHFESTLAGSFQIQGILVEEGPSDWLRFDFYSDGSRVYVFAASTRGGSTSMRYRSTVPSGVPLTMRVARSGDDWSQSWSMDGGVTWVQAAQFGEAFSVQRVGLFAGVAGSPAPAFTMVADYFFDGNAPIVPEDGTPGGGAFTIATGTTGAGAGTVVLDPDQATYSCGDVVTVTAVPANGSAFLGWSGGLSGTLNPASLVVSGDLTVTADFGVATPPSISNLSIAAGIGDATVRWTTDVPATSRVDYGTSIGYGETVEDLVPRVSHEVVLTGLAADTTYHLQATSTNEFGSDSTPDTPFSTSPSLGPVSDDFNRCDGVGGPWVLIDPAGGATATIAGAATDDASVVLDLPAGSVRDPWGSNGAVRLMQPSDDRDLVLEVEFDAVPTEFIQMEGLIVEQDAANWLRFDFFSLGSGVRAFAARTLGGGSAALFNSPISVAQGPIRMRVVRSGHRWTQSWSTDGGGTWQAAASFDQALVVSSVGVFAGTAGSSPPGMTVGVDFFEESADPLLVEDGPIDGGPYAVTLPGDGTVTAAPQQAEYFCGDQVLLTAVEPPGMVFAGWTGELAGRPISTLVQLGGDLAPVALFQPAPPPAITSVETFESSNATLVRWSTDVPSSSRVDYGTSSSYGATASDATATTEHALLLSGLLPATTYHFRITAQQAGGLASSTDDATFTTVPAGLSIGEDFGDANLDLGVWTLVNPRLDADLRIDAAHASGSALVLSVPGPRPHDAWGSNESVRLTRPLADVDFDVSVKMSGALDAPFQSQGLLFSGDPQVGDFVRVDYYHTGGGLRAFAATTTGGVSAPRLTANVHTGPWSGDLYLRVQRSGDLWTVYHSTDVPVHDVANLAHWSLLGSFVHSIDLVSTGPFVGNGGSDPPPHTAAFDWICESEAPLLDEDAPAAVDATAPYVYSSRVSVLGGDSTILRWRTDEPTDGLVRLGQTTAYELGATVSSTPGSYFHEVLLTGLQATTAYEYEVVTTDSVGLDTRISGTFTTTAVGGGGPEPQFDFWYADLQPDGTYRQEFGANGLGNLFCNVTGNVSDLDGTIDVLRYTLNGGPPVDLNMGPDLRRLLSPGDFNIDLHASDLLEGNNVVLVEAVDQWLNVATAEVIVDYTSDVVRDPSALLDWSAIDRITDVSQPIDGHWIVENGFLRTAAFGYDRLLAFGDVRWRDFEIEVPFTVHTVFADGFAWPSGHPLIGFCLRWREHSLPGQQPRYGFWPTGALAYFGFDDVDGGGRAMLRGNFDTASTFSYPSFELGVEHTMKARVTTLPSGESAYRFKLWRSSSPEPPWDVELVLPPGDPADPQSNPASGSPVLISHHLDVDFGTIRVQRLDE
ncbi:MAG: DUF1349 domain-containing protein [Planctomycetota bacterium]